MSRFKLADTLTASKQPQIPDFDLSSSLSKMQNKDSYLAEFESSEF